MTNELKKLASDMMPKSKKHYPLAVCFAVSFTVMVILCCSGSLVSIPFAVLTLDLSRKMEKIGVEVDE